MATEQERAALTTVRGKQAAQIKDPDEKKQYIKDSANVDKDYEGTANATVIKGNELQKQAVMGSLKKGGTIPKTGLYKLHKGEKVTPANKVKDMNKKMDAASMGLAKTPGKAMRVKKTTHMTIEPTDNKGFIIKHEEHHDGIPTGKRKHHVFSNAADMHKHVMKTYPAKPMEDTEAPAAPETSEAPAPAVGAPPAAM